MSDATVFSDIRQALRAQLLTAAGLPAARKWQGEDLDPPPNDPYIRETLLKKAPPVRKTIGGQPRFEMIVLYQVDLFWPVTNEDGTRTDVTDHELAAGAIAAAFPTTDDLVYGSARVHVKSAGDSTLIEDTPHNIIPITITAVASFWADN